MESRLSFTARRRLTLWAVIALVAIGTAVVATVAMAGQDHKFRATWFATGENAWSQGAWSYQTGVGTGSVLGRFTIVDAVLGQAHNTRCKGYDTKTDANGDELYSTYEQVWDAATYSWIGSYTITGGTGRFAGASGTGIKISTISIPWDGNVSVSWEGTINF